MFRTRCAGCHGPDARGYLGPDLTGLWAAGVTDDRIFDTVRRGVAGTEMPAADPQRVPDRDIWMILAYVHTLAAAVPAAAVSGNAANGAQIFRTNCVGCHMVGGEGGQLGPDLSRVGSGRPRSALAAKIRGTSDVIVVFPAPDGPTSATVCPGSAVSDTPFSTSPDLCSSNSPTISREGTETSCARG